MSTPSVSGPTSSLLSSLTSPTVSNSSGSSVPTLSAPGIGSGLNVQSIISKLMAIESQPLTNLQNEQKNLQSQLSAYGTLKSAFSTFQTAMSALSDPSQFAAPSATSSDPTVLTATADSTAANGTLSYTVQQIAQNQMMSAGTTYADTTTTQVASAGETMTITVGSNSFQVGIGGDTLSQVRDAINSASNNSGVTASIITDTSGNHLMLTSNNTGSANALQVSYSGSDPFNLQTINAGYTTPTDLDAKLTINNQFTVTSSSNTVSTAVQGLTLNLTGPGTATVTVATDTSAMQKKVQSLVDAYNNLMTQINKLSSGSLSTDSPTLVGLESQLRNVLNTPSGSTSGMSYLSDLGITTNKDTGLLQIDSTQLSSALSTNLSDVTKMIADPTTGIAAQFNNIANQVLSNNGYIDSRTSGLNSQITSLTQQESDMQNRLNDMQTSLTNQYTQLDVLMSQMQSTSTYLSQQLANLPTYSSSSSSKG